MPSAILLTLMVIAAYSMVSLASATDSHATMIPLDLNHSSSFWGILMDSEHETPSWHIRAAIAHLTDKKELVGQFNPSAIIIDNPVPKVPPLYPQWYLKWTRPRLVAADPLHGNTAMSLYNNVLDEPDIYEARDHLIAAGGIGNDTLPWHDNDNDGRIDNPPTSQIDFYTITETEAPTIFAIAKTIEQSIEYVFNEADVVNFVPCTFADFLWRVFDKTVPDDWHIALGVGLSVSTAPPPTFLYNLYHTNGDLNYVFYSNKDYDDVFEDPLNPSRAREAQLIFGKTIATIPIYCRG